MSISRRVALLSGAALVLLAGCGARGLPPAGPADGEVDIGYGTQPEEKITGAVTSLSEGKMGPARPIRLEELLRGRVPGLQIIHRDGGLAVFRIRGTSSLLNDQEPLFVVDGVQTSSAGARTALSGLSTEDITQIDVLKDVASTAIYGMRGAGGVILIATRR